jgi:BexC/CtrB/KpsE family polysaccharide export inner-membrane protein
MSDPKLSYLGPIQSLEGPKTRAKSLLEKIPFVFLLVVVLPTVVVAIYYLLIASPRYVSEARFVVRAAEKSQPSSLGTVLQTVGISSGSTDAHAVHDYVRSSDGLRDLMKRVDVKAFYSRPGVDPLSRLPKPFTSNSFEDFRKQFNKYVTVGYDSQTGISTLRVEAFTPQDAQKTAAAMLDSGEALVNTLNQRSSADAVADAERSVSEAQARLSVAQNQLTAFRNRERFVDPTKSALAGSTLIGELQVNVATLKAERAQVAADAPNSPQLPLLDSRIRAFEQQIAIENQKIVGDSDSLVPKISTYENLMMEREFADKLLASATASLNAAQLEARRQRLYIDRIVYPNAPDTPEEPKRFMAILAVFVSCLVMYLVGWLIWAGIRESRLHA